MKRGGYLVVAALALAASVARAQTDPPANYQLHDISFDMWCQETQHLDPDRCDKRLPEDEQAYQAYVAKIEKYELPYLKERDKQEEYNRSLLHNDPVDHPTQPSTPPIQPINSAPPK